MLVEEAHEGAVVREVRGGLVPVQLFMDSQDIATSVSTPEPLYCLFSRMSYLLCYAHLASDHFGDAVMDAKRTIWFEDTKSQRPLSWHLPIGVLLDARSSPELPWCITVHFHRFPRQIIPFEDCEALKQHFMHSMKQALFLESGSSKVAMSLSRSEQDAIWEAVVSSNKELFFPRTTEELKCIPVRVYEDGKGATTLHLSAASNVTIAGCMSVYNKTSTQGASTTNLFQCYYVQGIKVQEDTCLKWLWSTMRHADNFLYIVLAK